MVEYETLGIIVVVVGLVSYQIKLVDNRLKEEIGKAEATHKDICKKLTDHFKKCRCVCV
jgi:hypothetical protein